MLKDLPIPHEIILIKSKQQKQPFTDVLLKNCVFTETRKHLYWSPYSIKMLTKKSPIQAGMQVFFSEYGEIFKKSFFYRTPLVVVLKQVQSHQLLMIIN